MTALLVAAAVVLFLVLTAPRGRRHGYRPFGSGRPGVIPLGPPRKPVGEGDDAP